MAVAVVASATWAVAVEASTIWAMAMDPMALVLEVMVVALEATDTAQAMDVAAAVPLATGDMD